MYNPVNLRATLRENKMSQQTKGANTVMEVNGIPLYIKSDGEKGIPYLYDIDTNEHVGYWCQKKGMYIMFSPYEQILNNLKRSMREELRNSGGNKLKELEAEEEEAEEEVEEEVEEEAEEEAEEEEAEEVRSLCPTSTIFKLFVLMFIYIMCQKQFQSIHVDFVLAFTMLYTKIVKNVCLEL